jgi:type VI secretion system protein ImpB
MAKSQSSQKFIGKNRPPRVQIEYDLETYGAEEKKMLPFVMGIMSDLSGDRKQKLEKLSDRKFLEIDCDNFSDRMKAINPNLAYKVINTLIGEGEISIDIDFESMDDFSPAKVADKIEPLKKLLEARKELSNLMSYMDGKDKAEDLVRNILENPALLKSFTKFENKEKMAEIGENNNDGVAK